jgi:hypothetical protein
MIYLYLFVFHLLSEHIFVQYQHSAKHPTHLTTLRAKIQIFELFLASERPSLSKVRARACGKSAPLPVSPTWYNVNCIVPSSGKF